MLIILEGPDGAGKTRLATDLRKLIERQNPGCFTFQFHRGVPTAHPIDEYMRPINRYRPGGNRHVVIDRWHWGESVYPHIFNRPTQLDTPARWAIEAYLLRLGAIVVMVDQYDAAFYETYAQRDELHMVGLLQPTKKLFQQVAMESLLPYVRHNWQSPVEGDLNRVIDAATAVDIGMKDLSQFSTYCGPRWPGFLMFGDVRHNFGSARWNTSADNDPAFVPMLSTSGHYLLQALSNLPLEFQRRVGWANACDVDDPIALWQVLGKPLTIALGRNTQRKLKSVGIPHGVAPHPQFVRRFRHSHQIEYGTIVQRAVEKSEDLSSWHESLKVERDRKSITTS